MVRRLVLVWLVVSTVATLLAQRNTGAPVVPEQAIAPPPPLPTVTAKDLLDGLRNPGRWLTYSGDYTGQRHSPLTQITPANVSRLSSQWTFQAEGMPVARGFEGTPLMMDGVLYITGNNNYAWAIDVELCVFPQEGLTNNPGTEELLIEGLRRGARAIGAVPYFDTDPRAQIDRIFAIARDFDGCFVQFDGQRLRRIEENFQDAEGVMDFVPAASLLAT